jgi:hypothetical protein
MSERKGIWHMCVLCNVLIVLHSSQQVFSPDFDPSLIPRRKQPKNAQQVVRLMAPFSMCVSFLAIQLCEI